MQPVTYPYRCRLCSAASYRRLTHRGLDGAMQYSGLYRCSGCSVTFSDPAAWREGDEVAAASAKVSPVNQMPTQALPSYAASTADHSFATDHQVRPLMPGESVGFGHSEEDLREIGEAAATANKSKGRRR